VLVSLVAAPGQVQVPGNIFEIAAMPFNRQRATDAATLADLFTSLATGRLSPNVFSDVGSVGSSLEAIRDALQRIQESFRENRGCSLQ